MKSKYARVALANVVLVALTACGHLAERDPFKVFVQPGLEPRLTPQSVVPTSLPEKFGGIGFSGTIDSIEQVACVQGSRLPEVDPCLSVDESALVWVVIFRGQFVFSRWEGAAFKFDRGYYLVDDKSGQRFGGGTCPDA